VIARPRTSYAAGAAVADPCESREQSFEVIAVMAPQGAAFGKSGRAAYIPRAPWSTSWGTPRLGEASLISVEALNEATTEGGGGKSDHNRCASATHPAETIFAVRSANKDSLSIVARSPAPDPDAGAIGGPPAWWWQNRASMNIIESPVSERTQRSACASTRGPPVGRWLPPVLSESPVLASLG